MRRCWLVSILFGFLALCASPVWAVPLVNPGFEGGLGGWTQAGNVGSVNYTGAAVINQNVALFGNDGAVFNAGDAAPNGSLSQSFATVIGQRYIVEFYYGNFNQTGGASTQITLAEVLDDNTMSVIGSSLASVPLPGNSQDQNVIYNNSTPFQFSFVALGVASTLRFTDQPGSSTISTDGFLDTISVTEVVPEIGSVSSPALAAIVLLLLTSGRRRRQVA